LIALAISFAVDVAARQRARAAKREVEAHLLSRASTAPLGEGSLPRLLNDIKDTFGMTGVALLESRATGEEPVASVGTISRSKPVLSAPAGDSLRLVAWGPEVFGQDAAALRRMAGGRPGPLKRSACLPRQRESMILRKSIVPARLSSPPWATTCVRRWLASRSPSPACGSRMRRFRRRRRPNSSRPSRSRPTRSASWWTTCWLEPAAGRSLERAP
jgi:hypothetical protein